jgi:spore coat polysaccharide biosynthesis protein SpsF (cytidylyltransferase family)
MVKQTVKYQMHYTTNTINRTEREGYDCEVISRELMEFMDKNAKTPEQREHVTKYISDQIEDGNWPIPAFPFAICHVIDRMDLSHIKTSIDTQEDYDAALEEFKKIEMVKRKCRETGMFII